MLAQFLAPLAADNKRTLWLDQEFALQLKGSVVLAHQSELWRDIGEGLRPKLTRGVRIVAQASELNDQGTCCSTRVEGVLAAWFFDRRGAGCRSWFVFAASGGMDCCLLRLMELRSGHCSGPSGIAPVQDALVTALAHSVGANTVHLNLPTVERVRKLAALRYRVDPSQLSKAAVVSALMDALEDVYVETNHPAVVVFNDHPGWLLSNEAAAEVGVAR